MKECRSAAVIGCAVSTWLVAGCAGYSVRPEGFDFTNRPQMLIPGARRSDVKDLAVGSARAKGWTIVKSTDDLLVMQRTMDPASPSARASVAASSTVPPVIEVISGFAQESDGVNVGLGATLVTQPPGENSPKRIDYTENYRPALDQSLASLRATWEAKRPVSATPPARTRNEQPAPAPGEGAAAAARTNPAPPPAMAATPAAADPSGEPRSLVPPAPAPRAPEPWASPNPPPAPAGVQTATAAPMAPPPGATPESTPLQPSADSAPAVDGSRSASDPASGVQPLPEPLAPKDNMLALNPNATDGLWASRADQYARLRGCNVSSTQLIETRGDSEVHKVNCVDASNFLVACQNGACRGLE